MTAHTGNADRHQLLRPSPRGRNAVDLPFTPAMAAAAARVLEEIRTGPARDSGRVLPRRGRNAGGAARVCDDAPPATRADTRRNSRFPTDYGPLTSPTA